jgi:hypothetical protein
VLLASSLFVPFVATSGCRFLSILGWHAAHGVKSLAEKKQKSNIENSEYVGRRTEFGFSIVGAPVLFLRSKLFLNSAPVAASKPWCHLLTTMTK